MKYVLLFRKRRAVKLFDKIAELTKAKKHNVIFLVVPTRKEVAYLIKDLAILLQEYDLDINIPKGRFRIKGSAEIEAQKFVVIPNTPQKTKGLPEESVIYLGGV